MLKSNRRFDLKLIGKDDEGFLVLGNIDFKGYTADHNPKYYESVKIVSGNFLSPTKSSLLIISCNCADTNYEGKACKEFENIKELPNTIAIYQFE